MPISTVAQDAWGLNMVHAVYGVSLRLSTWSRTSSLCDGNPLYVRSIDGSVSVYQGWDPRFAGGVVAASVQGVPALDC